MLSCIVYLASINVISESERLIQFQPTIIELTRLCLSLWYVEFKRIGAALSILSHISIIITCVYDSKDCYHDDFRHKLVIIDLFIL